MQITLKNVGFISEAEVGLAGLNVIAGPNGTGKSTVGKTVYTIIKSISDCDSIVNEHREIIINSLCRAIF
ncbi:MAG: ATP-binding protein, partial [Fibromonadales bacterium]|nr:ATP-binding protein [Fibromonadales bacterium]